MNPHIPIAIVPLNELRLPGGNVFHTLHGYWIPPSYVISFWSSGAQIPYISEKDYKLKYEEILTSQDECVKQFWRENPI